MADIQRGMFLPHPGENPTASSDIGTTVLHMLRRALLTSEGGGAIEA